MRRHLKSISETKVNIATEYSKRLWLRGLMIGGVLGASLFSPVVTAQSVDALLDKLVEKGVLTVKEANQLREEADKNFTTAYSAKSGMPEWVTAFKINGDLRGRYEGFFYEDDKTVDRHRFRYRVRLGFTAVLKDDFEVGLRLGSGELDASGMIDPISNNQSLKDNASKKGIFIDLAYGKWSPIHTGEWNGSMTLGKMENPFTFPSTLMFDRDYTPEGAAIELAYSPVMEHSIKLVGAGYILDELSGDSNDPYLLGAQLRWTGTWTRHIASNLGISGWAMANKDQLANSAVPNFGKGNTRNDAGYLAHSFNPVQVDGSLTYTVDSVPMYSGPFPISLFGEYLNNPAAQRKNEGWAVGIVLGKSGKKGLWDVSYQYRFLAADAWYEEFTESDFGANYVAAPIGGSRGYGSGTNVRGHIVRGQFSPYDHLTFAVTYFLTELIDETPDSSDSGTGRLQVDAVLKF